MLGRQKQRVEFLSAQLEERTILREVAKARLSSQTRLFFSKPSNLLLPLGVGALATMMITRRKSATARKTTRTTLPVATIISAASAFWTATRPLRESLGFDPVERLSAAVKAAQSRAFNES